jgi:hypothetical protein
MVVQSAAKEEGAASELSVRAEDSATLDSAGAEEGAGTAEVTSDDFCPHAARKSETAAKGAIKGIFIGTTKGITKFGVRNDIEIFYASLSKKVTEQHLSGHQFYLQTRFS